MHNIMILVERILTIFNVNLGKKFRKSYDFSESAPCSIFQAKRLFYYELEAK